MKSLRQKDNVKVQNEVKKGGIMGAIKVTKTKIVLNLHQTGNAKPLLEFNDTLSYLMNQHRK